METIREIVVKVQDEYKKNLTNKLLLVDALIAFSLVTAFVQVLYVVLVGTFPFNSFLSGFLCCIALFSLTGD
jgi:oligosaccharyltransferase complex subunit epsilon